MREIKLPLVFILIAVGFLGGFFTHSLMLPNQKEILSNPYKALPLNQQKLLKCTDQELNISELEDYLKNNGLVLTLLRKNCELVLGSTLTDVTGDKMPDILLNTGGWNCASCHVRTVRVIDGIQNKIIFELRGDDLGIEKSTFPINGIQVTEPLRWHDVGFCCATEGLAYTYIYSPKDERGITESSPDVLSGIDAIYHEFASYSIIKDHDFFYLYDARSVKFKEDN